MRGEGMKRSNRIWRKVILCALAKCALSPLKLLPVKRNRVLFTSYLEKQYSCSPRYISEQLEMAYGKRLEIMWAFREPEKFAYLKQRGIRVLDAKSLEFFICALTSRVIVTNTYLKPSLPRRKGTFYLRTWHGGGAYKRVGSEVKVPLSERIFNSMRQKGADLYLSSSRAFTQMTLRGAFGYEGEVLECGLPRNDMLLARTDASHIREKLGLSEGDRLVLYAPTYRDDAKVHETQPDYARVTKALSRRFGGSWRVGFRSHHVTMYKNLDSVSRGAVNLTDYPDMQELLLASDALITDYSSSIWDYSLTGKPGFLYCPDLDEYRAERDFFTDISTWPFPLSQNTDELVNNIERFSESENLMRTRAHLEALGSCESGEAARITAEKIAEICLTEEKK